MKNKNCKSINTTSSGIALISLLIIIIIILAIILLFRFFIDYKHINLQTNTIISKEQSTGQDTQDEQNIVSITKNNIYKLKAGDYIMYDSGVKGEILCRVLYEATSPYGLQIISDKNVEEITLGGTNVDSAKKSYNEAISTLNNESLKYVNSKYALDARCIGSNPSNKNQEVEGPIQLQYYYEGKKVIDFKNEDKNYETDLNAMKEAISQGEGIHITGENYWLASRRVVQDDLGTFFRINYISDRGGFNNKGICYLYGSKRTECFEATCGLRPCITLKTNNLKIIEGSGTINNPCKFE